MGKLIDRTGRQYGFLTAIGPSSKVLSSGRKMPAWRLRCTCGNEVVALSVNLDKGHHQSCGCMIGRRAAAKREALAALRAERATARGAKAAWQAALTQTKAERLPWHVQMPEYRVHRQMLQRCYLPTARNYKWYGAKGVEICDRWRFGEGRLNGFQCFMNDMGLRPDGLTLDRIDPTKGYGPDNCRWATWKEQHANKREHHMAPAERAALHKQRGESRRKITPSMRQDILTRLHRGEKQWPIARALGISQTTVSYVKLGMR